MASVDPALLTLEKGAFSVASLEDESDERAFWRTRSPRERFLVVEYLRQMAYGYHPAAARLQRVLEVVRRP